MPSFVGSYSVSTLAVSTSPPVLTGTTHTGSQYIHTMKQLSAEESPAHTFNDPRTVAAITHARARSHKDQTSISPARVKWIEATNKILHTSQDHSARTIGDALRVGAREHMSEVDTFDGKGARAGKGCEIGRREGRELVTVQPVIDGRMKDVGRANKVGL